MENRIMLQRISNSFQGKNKRFAGFAAAVLAVSLGCSIAPLFAQEPGQRTFASTEEASRALFHAMQLQDEQAPLSILGRSEEHTSELQSRGHLVCRLLLEKKKPSKQATLWRDRACHHAEALGC